MLRPSVAREREFFERRPEDDATALRGAEARVEPAELRLTERQAEIVP